MVTNEQYFAYLEQLRKSGETNMMGARPYLQGNFGISRDEATKILQSWMTHKNEEAKKEN